MKLFVQDELQKAAAAAGNSQYQRILDLINTKYSDPASTPRRQEDALQQYQRTERLTRNLCKKISATVVDVQPVVAPPVIEKVEWLDQLNLDIKNCLNLEKKLHKCKASFESAKIKLSKAEFMNDDGMEEEARAQARQASKDFDEASERFQEQMLLLRREYKKHKPMYLPATHARQCRDLLLFQKKREEEELIQEQRKKHAVKSRITLAQAGLGGVKKIQYILNKNS